MDGKEPVPMNKIVQRSNGDYYKCAQSEDNDLLLEMRSPTEEELEEYLRKKVSASVVTCYIITYIVRCFIYYIQSFDSIYE